MQATVLLPLAVAVVSVAGTVGAAQSQPLARPLDALGIGLLIASAATLVVRSWNPSAVVAGAALIAAGYFAAGYPGGPAFLAAVVALCSAIVTGHRRGAYIVTALTFVLLVALHLIRSSGQLPLVGASSWLSTLIAIIAGAEWWRARSERQAHALTARTEAELRRVSEERLRIARELHDALGHHVSLINVQAGVAHYLLDDDLEQARSALAAITASSGELLVEMRTTLGMLRGSDEEPTRQPVAGLARLDDLAAASRAGGDLAVTVAVCGAARELPATVDLAAYRIVQEALTNTRKHAAAHNAAVLVTYHEDGVTVEISDDGHPAPTHPPPKPGGSGLPGMRERANALGGSFSAGPDDDKGGFRVQAHLPTLPACIR